MSQDFEVQLQGKSLRIPYRVYQKPMPSFIQSLLPKGLREQIQCRLTRHHDGHIREEFTKRILNSNNPLVAPFIIRLCGEYVIEILSVIDSGLDTCDQSQIRAFILENPKFYEQNRSRMVSYWDCYYRAAFPKLRDYVGYKLFKRLDQLSRAS